MLRHQDCRRLAIAEVTQSAQTCVDFGAHQHAMDKPRLRFLMHTVFH
jgi:hypothetical protein